MNKCIVLSVVVYSLFSCCAVKSRNDLTDGDIEDQKVQQFETFFKKFGSDSVYQKTNIKFPLKYYYYEDYGSELTSVDINNEEWHFINFSDDTLASSYAEDAYSISLNKKSRNEVEYVRSGIDNGISVIYHFRKEGRIWLLEKIIDRSN